MWRVKAEETWIAHKTTILLGTLKDCSTELEGTVTLPNLSDENDADDVDVSMIVIFVYLF